MKPCNHQEIPRCARDDNDTPRDDNAFSRPLWITGWMLETAWQHVTMTTSHTYNRSHAARPRYYFDKNS